MDERFEKTISALKSSGGDWAILTQPDSVAYATGLVSSIEVGQSPFTGGPATAIIGVDGTCALVVSNVENTADPAVFAERYVYDGFSADRYVDQASSYSASLNKAFAALSVKGRIAGEPQSFPIAAAPRISAAELIDISPSLNRERAVKTEAEKAMLRRSAEAAALGQRTLYDILKAERTELDIFSDIRRVVERFAGERVAIAGDCVSGVDRTAAVGGWPTNRTISEGEPVILDLAPRVKGYWGDSCSSVCIGAPSDGFKRLFDASQEALEHAIAILRPGISIGALDRQIRSVVEKHGFVYPHHSGHSIGTSVHEWPRIVPEETTPVEAGMFLMLEPSAYDPAHGGARLEWMVEVTSTGCVPVAPFEHRVSI